MRQQDVKCEDCSKPMHWFDGDGDQEPGFVHNSAADIMACPGSHDEGTNYCTSLPEHEHAPAEDWACTQCPWTFTGSSDDGMPAEVQQHMDSHRLVAS